MAIDINIPSQVKTYANLAAFPATGTLKTIFIAEDTNKTYRWTGSAYVEISATAASTWGAIGGTLSNQTDLQTALNAKQDSLGFTAVPTSRTLTINGTTQDLSADRTFTISTGITIGTTAITSGTVGRVLFEGTGNVVQESANLFWDNTNSRLGIGTSTPTSDFALIKNTGSGGSVFATIQNTNSSGEAAIIIKNNLYYAGIELFGSAYSSGGLANQCLFTTQNGITNLAFATLGVANISFRTNSTGSSNERLTIFGSTGNIGINTTTDAGYKLDVNGTARVATSLVLNGSASLLSSTISAYQSGTNRILSLATSTSKTTNNGGSLFTINTNEASTPQSLNVQYIASTFINDRSYSLQTSETGVAYGGGIVLQKDGGWVGIGSSSQFASAILALTSTDKGFLPPRMTTTQKNAIASPATGLMVYDTTLNLISVYNGTTWITL